MTQCRLICCGLENENAFGHRSDVAGICGSCVEIREV
jgi:hypothetical protein